MSAAKWHRERAAEFTKRADECPDQGYDGWVFGYRDNAAHHATAADALDALAVVADLLPDLLADLATAQVVAVTGPRHGGYILTTEQRASLAALAKIAKESK